MWLTVEEADVPPKHMETYLQATSRDTVRSRLFTGKPCRMLKNDWTEAWERDDTPEPLGMPLQMMVAIDAVSRGHAYPEAASDAPRRCAGLATWSSEWSRTTSRPSSGSSWSDLDHQFANRALVEGRA